VPAWQVPGCIHTHTSPHLPDAPTAPPGPSTCAESCCRQAYPCCCHTRQCQLLSHPPESPATSCSHQVKHPQLWPSRWSIPAPSWGPLVQRVACHYLPCLPAYHGHSCPAYGISTCTHPAVCSCCWCHARPLLGACCTNPYTSSSHPAPFPAGGIPSKLSRPSPSPRDIPKPMVNHQNPSHPRRPLPHMMQSCSHSMPVLPQREAVSMQAYHQPQPPRMYTGHRGAGSNPLHQARPHRRIAGQTPKPFPPPPTLCLQPHSWSQTAASPAPASQTGQLYQVQAPLTAPPALP
jgi:hypothetical protein